MPRSTMSYIEVRDPKQFWRFEGRYESIGAQYCTDHRDAFNLTSRNVNRYGFYYVYYLEVYGLWALSRQMCSTSGNFNCFKSIMIIISIRV